MWEKICWKSVKKKLKSILKFIKSVLNLVIIVLEFLHLLSFTCALGLQDPNNKYPTWNNTWPSTNINIMEQEYESHELSEVDLTFINWLGEGQSWPIQASTFAPRIVVLRNRDHWKKFRWKISVWCLNQIYCPLERPQMLLVPRRSQEFCYQKCLKKVTPKMKCINQNKSLSTHFIFEVLFCEWSHLECENLEISRWTENLGPYIFNWQIGR